MIERGIIWESNSAQFLIFPREFVCFSWWKVASLLLISTPGCCPKVLIHSTCRCIPTHHLPFLSKLCIGEDSRLCHIQCLNVTQFWYKATMAACYFGSNQQRVKLSWLPSFCNGSLLLFSDGGFSWLFFCFCKLVLLLSGFCEVVFIPVKLFRIY